MSGEQRSPNPSEVQFTSKILNGRISRRHLLDSPKAATTLVIDKVKQHIRSPEKSESLRPHDSGILQIDFFDGDDFLRERFGDRYRRDLDIMLDSGRLVPPSTKEERMKIFTSVLDSDPQFAVTWAAVKEFYTHGKDVGDSIWLTAQKAGFAARFDRVNLLDFIHLRYTREQEGYRLIANLDFENLSYVLQRKPNVRTINLSFQGGEVELFARKKRFNPETGVFEELSVAEIETVEAYTPDKVENSMQEVIAFCEDNPDVLLVTAAGNDGTENGSDLTLVDTDVPNLFLVGELVDGQPVVPGAHAYFPNMTMRNIGGSSHSVAYTATLASLFDDKVSPVSDIKKRILAEACDSVWYKARQIQSKNGQRLKDSVQMLRSHFFNATRFQELVTAAGD